MGIVARLCSRVIMSEEGRLALSGPDVIETVAGVEEFDARDRALVWRVTGGKHRLLIGDCDTLVDDDIDAFRNAAADAIERGVARAPTRAVACASSSASLRSGRSASPACATDSTRGALLGVRRCRRDLRC